MALKDRVKRLTRVGSKFLLVGGLSTLIEIAVLNLLLYVAHMNETAWGLVAAKIIASLVALVNAYFGNREWTYRGRDRRSRRSEISWFLLVNLVCLLIGSGLFWIGVVFAEFVLERAPGPFAVNFVNLVSIGIVVVIRFVLYHYIVFRAPKKA